MGFAVQRGRLSAGEAFRLSRLDEDYQAELWGADEEAAAKAAELLAEIKIAERFLGALTP